MAERTFPGIELVENFQNSFKHCFSTMLCDNPLDISSEEFKKANEENMQKVVECAARLNTFFKQKRMLAIAQKPECATEMDIQELKEELERKEALLEKYHNKIGEWQSLLKDIDGVIQSPPTTSSAASQPLQNMPPVQQGPSNQFQFEESLPEPSDQVKMEEIQPGISDQVKLKGPSKQVKIESKSDPLTRAHLHDLMDHFGMPPMRSVHDLMRHGTVVPPMPPIPVSLQLSMGMPSQHHEEQLDLPVFQQGLNEVQTREFQDTLADLERSLSNDDIPDVSSRKAEK